MNYTEFEMGAEVTPLPEVEPKKLKAKICLGKLLCSLRAFCLGPPFNYRVGQFHKTPPRYT